MSPDDVDAEPDDERAVPPPGAGRVRMLAPPADDAVPLYVQEQGAFVGKRSETLVVTRDKEPLAEVRLIEVSQLVLCGNIGISAQALHLLCESGVPVIHLSSGHWFHGITHGHGPRNAFDRAAQFRRTVDDAFCMRLSRAFVVAKARNQRTLLRRNGPSGAPVLDELKAAIRDIPEGGDRATLMGAEGRVAALYFAAFASMLKGGDGPGWSFAFTARNRRPPQDPVNALLSFGYGLLVKDVTLALLAVGLDPYWGVFHVPRHGRPALALDVMEELRPVIVDSAVITAINTGAVGEDDFQRGANGCALTPAGRKAFLRTYEARLDQTITHPIFGYTLSWRRALHLQAQLLARVFRGELDDYPPLVVR